MPSRPCWRKGTLRVTGPDGVTRSYGDGTGTPVHLRSRPRQAARKLALDADLYLGECYMDGSIDVTDGTIYDVLALLMANVEAAQDAGSPRPPHAWPAHAA